MKRSIVGGIGQAAKDILIIVDKYPKYGLKKRVEQIIIDGGGPVANALYTLSKFGIKTRISTVVGDDNDGDFIIKKLKEVNIDTQYIMRRKSALSHVAYIVVEKTTGNRTIFYKPCSGRDLSSLELDSNFFNNISFLHLDGFQEEISIYAAKYAHKNSIPVMLDAGSYKEYMTKIIKLTDYVVASSVFAEHYGFDRSLKKFKELVKYFKRPHLTITMGENGSITFDNGIIFWTPAYNIKALDTTGAGDVFHGAMIYGILRRFDIIKSVKFATVVAALKCRDYGGRRGIPTLNYAMKHLEKLKQPTILHYKGKI
ncbi:MAG: PfkB family carbohydrate kinase [Deltaproteobacteria bacterium]|nr:PfkB family carbohydrate kinase [Deltaproteobacteria bacterium]